LVRDSYAIIGWYSEVFEVPRRENLKALKNLRKTLENLVGAVSP
jgi:hypothetical protein